MFRSMCILSSNKLKEASNINSINNDNTGFKVS